MTVKERITATLQLALTPESLVVIDESHQHAGHGGWREGGETHFRVEIVASAFAGRSRIERHRMVNALLAAELADRVHALALATRTPEEAAGASGTSGA
ncbi:MAG: BolA family transcriptional regulator [Bosea sp.]|jgi:BolA protein|nr:BolA family transcriptional regulator [Bosea sp. (in: a-proteobacteria)]